MLACVKSKNKSLVVLTVVCTTVSFKILSKTSCNNSFTQSPFSCIPVWTCETGRVGMRKDWL